MMTAFCNRYDLALGEVMGNPEYGCPKAGTWIRINNLLSSLTDSIRLYWNSEFQL